MVREFVRSSCSVFDFVCNNFGMSGPSQIALCSQPFCCAHNRNHFVHPLRNVRGGHRRVLPNSPSIVLSPTGACICQLRFASFQPCAFVYHNAFDGNCHPFGNGNHHFGGAHCPCNLQVGAKTHPQATHPKTPQKQTSPTPVGSHKNSVQTHPIFAFLQVE